MFEKIKQMSGLGIKNLRVFNLVLLGKWRWGMLVEKDSLWHKVLVGICGLKVREVCGEKETKRFSIVAEYLEFGC